MVDDVVYTSDTNTREERMIERTPILAARQIASVVHKITSVGQPLDISRQAAEYVVAFLDKFFAKLFRLRASSERIDMPTLEAFFAPPAAGRQRAAALPIPHEIAELIVLNGRAAVDAAHRGHSVLTTLDPAQLQPKFTRYRAFNGRGVVLSDEAAVFMASAIEYLVTEISSVAYHTDFRTKLTTGDLMTVFSSDSDGMGKLHAFADPAGHRSMQRTDRVARPARPSRRGTSMSDAYADDVIMGYGDDNRGSYGLYDGDRDSRDRGRSRSPSLNALGELLSGRQPPRQRRPSMDIVSTSYGPRRAPSEPLTKFKERGRAVPRSRLLQLFKQSDPRTTYYDGISLAAIYDNVDFMDIRRAFPSITFAAEFNQRAALDPLMGYLQKKDAFAVTFTAYGQRGPMFSVIVHFRVVNQSYKYLQVKEAMPDGSGRRLAVLSNPYYVWMRLR